MEKMRMESPDGVQLNVEKLATLFPNCVTETKGEDGKLKNVVNFDLLRQMLSDEMIEGDEAYEFTWVGKKAAIVEANRPIRMTLRPCPEESVNWDTTENLYIEGDNLSVLKLLQESYLGKVKMIYIDPPYNTGNDFVYQDDFSTDKQEYDERIGAISENGDRLFRNTDSNGRFHSDWCSMIYPRLSLARNLLTEDGAIFMSIDDNEVTNLRKIADEIFGESNFISQIIWKKRSTPPNDQVVGAQHEYILAYAKNMATISLNLRERSDEQKQRYRNPDNHPKGPWAPGDLSANVKGGRYVASLNYPIVNPNTGEEHWPPHNGNWRFNREKVEMLLKNNEISFGEDGLGRPKLKRFLCDVKQGITYTSLWDFVPLNTQGSKEMTDLLGNLAVFDNPKPVGLIMELLKLGSESDSIVLDFFSGSGTTAHATMQLNAEDGGHRKFIMVQLPEKTESGSEARKAGFESIPQIGRKRIMLAGKKIIRNLNKNDIDIGFRSLRLDETNMKNVYYVADELTQATLLDMVSNIKEDRTSLDLLFGCLLEWGLPLSLPYTSEQIEGCTVHTYNDGDLIACFNENVPDSVIKIIAQRQPLRALFRDSCFADSPTKINVGEIFKLLAPDTRMKVI